MRTAVRVAPSSRYDVQESILTEAHLPPGLRAPPTQRDRLCLFAGPYVVQGDRTVPVPEGTQRLVVFVALRGGRADRRSVAGSLWPDGTEDRAAGNLRSALWRLKGAGLQLLQADRAGLVLDGRVDIDVREVSAWGERLTRGVPEEHDLSLADRIIDPDQLLPGWYDDWVIFERERLRQRILHALEALSEHQRQAGRHAEAVEAAMCAVHLEPLRETAQRMLIRAHLTEGNRTEAIRALDAYARLLRDELGVPVDRDLHDLVRAGST